MGIVKRIARTLPPAAPPPRNHLEAKERRGKAAGAIAMVVLTRLGRHLGPNGIDRLHPTEIAWTMQFGDHPMRGAVTPRLVHAVLSELTFQGVLRNVTRTGDEESTFETTGRVGLWRTGDSTRVAEKSRVLPERDAFHYTATTDESPWLYRLRALVEEQADPTVDVRARLCELKEQIAARAAESELWQRFIGREGSAWIAFHTAIHGFYLRMSENGPMHLPNRMDLALPMGPELCGYGGVQELLYRLGGSPVHSTKGARWCAVLPDAGRLIAEEVGEEQAQGALATLFASVLRGDVRDRIEQEIPVRFSMIDWENPPAVVLNMLLLGVAHEPLCVHIFHDRLARVAVHALWKAWAKSSENVLNALTAARLIDPWPCVEITLNDRFDWNRPAPSRDLRVVLDEMTGQVNARLPPPPEVQVGVDRGTGNDMTMAHTVGAWGNAPSDPVADIRRAAKSQTITLKVLDPPQTIAKDHFYAQAVGRCRRSPEQTEFKARYVTKEDLEASPALRLWETPPGLLDAFRLATEQVDEIARTMQQTPEPADAKEARRALLEALARDATLPANRARASTAMRDPWRAEIPTLAEARAAYLALAKPALPPTPPPCPMGLPSHAFQAAMATAMERGPVMLTKGHLDALSEGLVTCEAALTSGATTSRALERALSAITARAGHVPRAADTLTTYMRARRG